MVSISKSCVTFRRKSSAYSSHCTWWERSSFMFAKTMPYPSGKSPVGNISIHFMYWLLIFDWPTTLKKLVERHFNHIWVQAVSNKTIVKGDTGELLLVQLFFQFRILSTTPAFFSCWESYTVITTAPNRRIIKVSSFFFFCSVLNNIQPYNRIGVE